MQAYDDGAIAGVGGGSRPVLFDAASGAEAAQPMLRAAESNISESGGAPNAASDHV